MIVLIIIVHIIVAVFLILTVLLQAGKGADLAGAFGGAGSETAFGSRGTASLLSKLTTASAIIFMLSSLGLSILSLQNKSLIQDEPQEAVVPPKGSAVPEQKSTAPTDESAVPAGPVQDQAGSGSSGEVGSSQAADEASGGKLPSKTDETPEDRPADKTE